MRTRSKLLIVSACAFAAAGGIALTWTWLRSNPAPTITTSGTAAIGGPFSLVASDGAEVTNETYRGKWLLIYFGYTFCPDACPTALANISVALEKLGAQAGQLQPLFITVDPQRDTRDVMAAYLKAFDPRIVGLTGSKTQVDSVIKEYRIYAAPQKNDGDPNYPVAHSAYLFLMDPHGTFVSLISGNASGEEIAAWLRKKMGHPKE
jgi:protein SCO1